MRIAPGRHRIAENYLRAKHVVAAGWLTWDAGSIPAASTIFRKAKNGALRRFSVGELVPNQRLHSRISGQARADICKIHLKSGPGHAFVESRFFLNDPRHS